MKTKILIILLLSVNVGKTQSLERITIKLSEEVCTCITENKQFTSPTVAYNHCEQQTLNNLKPLLTANELDVVQTGSNLTSIRRGLFLKVNENCTYLRETLNPNLKIQKREEFPISLKSDSYKQLKFFDGDLVSVQGIIKKVQTFKGLPYFQIETDGDVLLVSGAFKSGFEKVGNQVKVLGFVGSIQKNKSVKKLQKGHTHEINAYGIVDTSHNDIAYFPGFENKMSIWREGRLPK